MIAAVCAPIAVQMLQIAVVIHRESLTFDENDHMYAGYRMWKNGDYGLNPEHPPLVKLLATLPVLGENLRAVRFRRESGDREGRLLPCRA